MSYSVYILSILLLYMVVPYKKGHNTQVVQRNRCNIILDKSVQDNPLLSINSDIAL